MKKLSLIRNLLLVVLFCSLFTSPASSQEEAKQEESTEKSSVQVNFGADLVSRYIWRGTDYGNSPSIQPNLSLTAGGFKIGAWGCYGFGSYKQKVNDSTTLDMGHYAEFDLFVSYTLKGFTLGVTDYFFPNPLNPNSGNKYFNYKSLTTGHSIEASLTYDGPAKFPVQVYVGTMIYGNDPVEDSTGAFTDRNENNFSTYIEASYKFNIKKIGVDVKPFIGGIPFGSILYGPQAGIVNLGLTASKAIKITEHYSIPIYTSVITNPQAESVFLVFGLTL
jgi:hypothetical protein